ncbi:MAG: TatD family hydrolase [Chloroflexota bacterium]
MLVDTHCHIQLGEYEADREAVIRRAQAAGVTSLVCVGYDTDSNRHAQALVWGESAARPSKSGVQAPTLHLYATAGLHPHHATDLTTAFIDEIHALCAAGRVVAVGECGLDFYRDLSPRERQRQAFVTQIELARAFDLPLVVHDREAHEEVVALLVEHKARRGVMHCFSGDWELARRCLDLGFFISIAGPVTYKNAAHLPEVAARVPADRLVLETDSPFLSPHPFRGQRNEPARVRLTAERVAQARGVDLDRLAEQTTANATALFGLTE